MYTNNKVGNVIYKVIEYFGDDVRRINHFLKVYGYAKMIGECENLDDSMQEILEVTAVLHDVGIKVAEQKYNSSAGHYQQLDEYSCAAEPPVQCSVSHLSRRSEPQ